MVLVLLATLITGSIWKTDWEHGGFGMQDLHRASFIFHLCRTYFYFQCIR